MSKRDGIKAGDRVRVTFEGVFKPSLHGGGFSVEDADVYMASSIRKAGFDDKIMLSPTFQITRIEPAFKVGDEVLVLGRHRNSNETVVGFLKDGRAIVEYQAGDSSSVCAYDTSCLTHA